MNHDPQPTKPKRRWFRFRLRTLLGVVTVLALLMGWIAKERSQSEHERQIAEQLEKLGADVTFGGPYDLLELQRTLQPQGWWRMLAGQVLGERILAIEIGRDDFGDLTPLAGLKNLQRLGLNSTAVKDLAPLAGLKNLQSLDLSSTSVRDLAPLAGLKNLYSLDLVSTPVSDLRPLAGLKNLQSLGLVSTPVRDLMPLADLKSLLWLGLNSTPVRDLRPLAGLKNLELLSLVSTPVRDLTPLAGLKKLKLLALGSTQVSDVEVKSLQESLPDCRIER